MDKQFITCLIVLLLVFCAQLDNIVAILLFPDHSNYLVTALLSCNTDNGQNHKNKTQVVINPNYP